MTMDVATIPEPRGLSFELPKSLSFDDWREVGARLASTQKTLNWWIGDWWAFGQHRYGERAKIAAEGVFGKEFGTVANDASVCRSFETSRRREVLSFSHHREVSMLEPEEADRLLDGAVSSNQSVRELRKAVQERRLEMGHFVVGGPDDDPDAEDKFLKKVQWLWNRAPEDWRQNLLDILSESDLADIDV